jgi:hypothetical protein
MGWQSGKWPTPSWIILTSAMMAEMLSLRFETTAPDSLFLALFLRRFPSETTLPRRTTQRRQRWRHKPIFSGTPETHHPSPLFRIPSPPCQSVPLRPTAVQSLQTAAPGRPIAAAAEVANRPAAPHQAARTARNYATFTGGTAMTPQAAASPVIGRKTRLPPWTAQCSRRPHLSSGFGF